MNQVRRRLFKTTLISTALLSLPQSLLAASRPPLTIPPLLESRRGKPVLLGMESTQVKLQNNLVDVWGFNGQYLGPTVKVSKGRWQANFSAEQISLCKRGNHGRRLCR